jgi:hypothetical protein
MFRRAAGYNFTDVSEERTVPTLTNKFLQEYTESRPLRQYSSKGGGLTNKGEVQKQRQKEGRKEIRMAGE